MLYVPLLKKVMRRFVVLMLLGAALASCGLTEIGGEKTPSDSGDIWGGLQEDSSAGGDDIVSVCYLTGLDYRKGYDWRSDNASGSVRCSLVVYANGVPVMKIPVGDEYAMSSDSDMHRIIDGHLYSDYSMSSETVIKKDGKELFSYPGRECICGMQVVDGEIYTLGQNRDRAGFAYRKNGETVIAREQGRVIGTLCAEADSLMFSFSETISSAQGNVERYYGVKSGKVQQIALREDIVKVWDILPYEGGFVYVATLKGIAEPVLVSDSQLIALPLPKGAKTLSCSLFRCGNRIGIEGLYTLSDGSRHNLIWLDGRVMATFGSGMSVSVLYAGQDGVCCALNPVSPGGSGVIYRCGEEFPMPAGYACMGAESMSMVDGILTVGLSSLKGERPLVWRDCVLDTLDINGFLTGVYSQPGLDLPPR